MARFDALLIGVSTYEHLEPLPSINDIRILEAVLRGVGYSVEVVNADPLEAQAVQARLTEKLASSQAETLLIFFAGHGYYTTVGRTKWLLTHEFNPHDTSSLAERHGAIPIYLGLDHPIERSRARLILFALDVCQTLAPSQSPGWLFPEQNSNNKPEDPGQVLSRDRDKAVAILSSCDTGEASYCFQDHSCSCFTMALARAFVKPEVRTLSELSESIKTDLPEILEVELKGQLTSPQQPRLYFPLASEDEMQEIGRRVLKPERASDRSMSPRQGQTTEGNSNRPRRNRGTYCFVPPTLSQSDAQLALETQCRDTVPVRSSLRGSVRRVLGVHDKEWLRHLPERTPTGVSFSCLNCKARYELPTHNGNIVANTRCPRCSSRFYHTTFDFGLSVMFFKLIVLIVVLATLLLTVIDGYASAWVSMLLLLFILIIFVVERSVSKSWRRHAFLVALMAGGHMGPRDIEQSALDYLAWRHKQGHVDYCPVKKVASETGHPLFLMVKAIGRLARKGKIERLTFPSQRVRLRRPDP